MSFSLYKFYDFFFSNKIEKDIFEILKKTKTGKIINVFDLGCFEGSFSKRLNEYLKSNYKTSFFLFDPNPRIKNKLRELKFKYKFFNVAINNLVGKKKFFINTQFEASGSSLLPIVKNSKLYNFSRKIFFLTSEPLFKKIQVDAKTLNYFINLNKVKKIDILKIDCEGNEINILNSCKKNLNNIKIIYLEVLSEKKNWNKKFSKINSLLTKKNFELIKVKKIPEGSFLSSLKICDVLFHNKSYKN